MPLDLPLATPFSLGDWIVDPASGAMARGTELVRLDERALRLLLCLAEHAGEVLSMEQLLGQVWPDVVVSPDSVYQAITSLRRQLGDDTRQPRYIATVPRRGYRLIASITPQAPAPAKSARRPSALLLRGVALILLVASLVAVAVLVRQAASGAPARSIAVLPFLDLTDEMNEEPFAEGMAEELIGKLSKVPGLAVAPPASSNAFQAKQASVSQVAKALNVAYVLDGSVRKSGSTLRVAARLTRAADGFVVWSGTYDRSWSDKLRIQEDIAGEASQALAKSLTDAARPGR